MANAFYRAEILHKYKQLKSSARFIESKLNTHAHEIDDTLTEYSHLIEKRFDQWLTLQHLCSSYWIAISLENFKYIQYALNRSS